MADTKVADDKPEESRPLNDDEVKAIEELKSRFTPEELANVPEWRYVMFIRGYWQEKDRAETTYAMLKRTLEYRREMDSDGLLNKKLEKEEKYLQCWPYDYHGTDKRGHIIYYERTTFSDPTTLLGSLTEQEIEQCHIQMQEVLLWLKAKKSEEIGAMTYKSVVIMDMQDFGFKHLSSSLYGAIKKILTIDQYYYPETLYKLLIINAPFSFRTLWAVVKPWLHPLTQARIQITGGAKEYLPKMKEFIAEDQIPRYIGGGCSCCEDTGIDKQTDRIYARNCQWREERLKKLADQAKDSATGATDAPASAPADAGASS